jgi:hypothetical protein
VGAVRSVGAAASMCSLFGCRCSCSCSCPFWLLLLLFGFGVVNC